MPGLEAQTIQELLSCEKRIIEPPKKDAVLKNRHFAPHTHTLQPDSYAAMEPEYTDKYAAFQDAIAYFIKRCNIAGADQYFPFLKKSAELQRELGFEDE